MSSKLAKFIISNKKLQILTGHVTVQHAFVVVLTNYVVNLTIFILKIIILFVGNS